MARKKTPLQERFGDRVRKLREKTGLSQEAFALAAGIDRTYYASVERGERNVTLAVIEKVAKGLGVPMAGLFRF